MMTLQKQVKKDDARFAILLAVALVFLAQNFLVASTVGDDPHEILQKVRMSQTAQHRVLEGRVRTGGAIIPFRLTLDGSEVRYEFADPALTLILRLDEKESSLLEVSKKGEIRTHLPAEYDRSVCDTVITYEDLSMRFLYWSAAKIEGEQIMLTRNCWILHLDPASPRDSQYGFVKIWVEKQSGALVRVETYDRAGKMTKRFEVRSVQKIEGGYILKQMRIQRMQDGKPADPTPTYLEITKPADGAVE